MSAYNRATMSGFILGDSILPGLLQDEATPVVAFEVVTGKVPYSVFIVDARLGVDMYAWKMSMRKLGMLRVHVVVKADLMASGLRSVLIMKEVEYHASNPELRVESERCANEMMTGRTAHEWPDRIIRMPVKVLRQLNICGS